MTRRTQATGGPFDRLNTVLNKHFHRPDLQAVRIALGTIRAHQLDLGDPAWLFIVAPPGSGKTVISIMGAAGLDGVITLGDLTPNTLLSGFYDKKQPGLLEKLGIQKDHKHGTKVTEGNAVLLIKDFTTVLSMRNEKRQEILAQLREVHDGEFRKDWGTGDTKIWRGRVTVVAAVTPAIDLERYYGAVGALGERFLRVRVARPDSEAGVRAIGQQGDERKMRRELQQEVRLLFVQAERRRPRLPKAQVRRIAAVAELTARARTTVYRDGNNRSVEGVAEPEANTRLSKGLAAMARGIASLQRRSTVGEDDIQDVFRVALDCIPAKRRKLLAAIAQNQDPTTVGLPRTTCNRELEDLEALDLIENSGLAGASWQLTAQVKDLLRKAKATL